MASAIFNVFFKIMGTIVGIITTPLNLVLATLFPEFTTIIMNFNNGVTTLFGGSIGYFSSMLPPITRATILFYLFILINYYVVVLNAHLILKVITIIKNVKIW